MVRRKAVRLGARNGNSKDRISELHIDLKHLILQHLLVTEIARTSVLSSQWRHVHLSHRNLIFDRNSFHDMLKRKNRNTRDFAEEFMMIIKSIMTRQSTGAIDKFTLFIPKKGGRQGFRYSYKHVNNVTRLIPASITQLCIDNNDDLVLFLVNISCFQKLTYLEIKRCLFDPETISITPLTKLTQLNLTSMNISHDLLQTISRIAPRLNCLSLRWCRGTDNRAITIDVPSLTQLVMDDCKLEVCSFSETCTLSSLTFSLRSVGKPSIGFHRVLPKLKGLEILDFYTVEVLSTSLNSKQHSDDTPWPLQKLILHGIGMTKYQYTWLKPVMPHLIVLLKRAKYVEELCITHYIHQNTRYTENLQKYFDIDLSMDRLLSISYVFPSDVGDDAVPLRFLLGHSPALMKLNIGYSKSLSLEARERVKKRISEFYRASLNVKVRFFNIDDGLDYEQWWKRGLDEARPKYDHRITRCPVVVQRVQRHPSDNIKILLPSRENNI